MAWLTIAGIDLEIVADNSAQRNAPVLVGERARTFNGTLRSSLRATKRSWAFLTKNMLLTDIDTLATAVADDAIVTVAGTPIGASSISAMVTITGLHYVADPPTDTLAQAALTIEEV